MCPRSPLNVGINQTTTSSNRKLFSYCGFVPRLRGDKPAIWPPHTKFPILWGKEKQALFGAFVCLWRGTTETGVIQVSTDPVFSQ